MSKEIYKNMCNNFEEGISESYKSDSLEMFKSASEIALKMNSLELDKPRVSVPMSYVPIAYFFKGIGIEVCDLEDIETNGWQHDFFIEFEKDGHKYALEGSLFYGNYRLHLMDEDLEQE